MPIHVVKYHLKNNRQKPVEYIGIGLEPLRKGVCSQENLKFFLQEFKPEEMEQLILIHEKPEVIFNSIGSRAMKHHFSCGFEIHLIECYQPVKKLLNVADDERPSAEDLHAYIGKIVREYQFSYLDELMLCGEKRLKKATGLRQKGMFANRNAHSLQQPSEVKSNSCRIM